MHNNPSFAHIQTPFPKYLKSMNQAPYQIVMSKQIKTKYSQIQCNLSNPCVPVIRIIGKAKQSYSNGFDFLSRLPAYSAPVSGHNTTYTQCVIVPWMTSDMEAPALHCCVPHLPSTAAPNPISWARRTLPEKDHTGQPAL